MTLVALFLALLFAYGLVSERLERTLLTAPMCFTIAGIATFLCSSGRIQPERDPEAFLRIAELGLVLLLPVIGTLVAGVGAPDLSALLTNLPRLFSMLLVDVPKAVLDYLAPFLQLKTALEGKA